MVGANSLVLLLFYVLLYTTDFFATSVLAKSLAQWNDKGILL